jgi:hypothetical protein
MEGYNWGKLRELGFSEESINAINAMTPNSLPKEPGGGDEKNPQMAEVGIRMPRMEVLKRANNKNGQLAMAAQPNYSETAMKGPFNFPSVDHLLEGRDYRIVDWEFAQNAPVEKQPPEETVQPNQQNAPAAQNQAPAPQAPPPQPQASAPPAQSTPAAQSPAPAPQQTGACKPDERSVFGVCRKTGEAPKDDKDFDSSNKTDEEKAAEAEAKKQGSDVKNNKPVLVNGKKMGWAVKNGRPVLVEWGSVAGAKPAPKPQVKGASGGPKPLTGQSTKPKEKGMDQQQPTAPKSDPAAKVSELQQAMRVPGLPESAQKALQAAIDLIGA